MMKKKISFMLAGVLVLTLFTGFGQMPDVSAEITKAQEQLLVTAERGGDSSEPLENFEVPERFIGSWTGINDLIQVTADAEIVLPAAGKIPSGTIARRDFTQEDADILMRVLLNGNTLYEELGMTKQQALERLERYRAMQRGDIPVEGDSVTYDTLPQTIERWEEYVRTAPSGDERIPASTTFAAEGPLESIRGWAELDGIARHFYIQNVINDYSYDHAIVYEDGYGDLNSSYAIPFSWLTLEDLPWTLTVDFSLEDAILQADALMEELGFEDVVCDDAYPVCFFDRNFATASETPTAEEWNRLVLATGYELQYVRCLDGFPISYTPASGTASPENESFSGTWMYEFITMDITEDGPKCFQWFSPHTEPELQVEDTRLMPFSEIAEVFAKMIMVKNGDIQHVNERNGFTTTRIFHIDKVKLGLMRLRSKGNINDAVLIPVWDFWGTETWEYDGWDNYGYSGDVEEKIVLTVNAVDGSLIDRELGY